MGSDNCGGRGRGGARPAALSFYRQRNRHPPGYLLSAPGTGRFRKVFFRDQARTSALMTLKSDQVA
jgi:hypothetical protein